MLRRNFLSSLGKAFGVGAAAIVAAPAVSKPEPEVRIVEKIIEVEKKWIKPPRPDLSHLPWGKVERCKSRYSDFQVLQEGQMENNVFNTTDVLFFRGPNEARAVCDSMTSIHNFGRNERESYGFVADMADYYAQLCGARFDEDRLEMLWLGRYGYHRKRARHIKNIDERVAYCRTHKIKIVGDWPM